MCCEMKNTRYIRQNTPVYLIPSDFLVEFFVYNETGYNDFEINSKFDTGTGTKRNAK